MWSFSEEIFSHRPYACPGAAIASLAAAAVPEGGSVQGGGGTPVTRSSKIRRASFRLDSLIGVGERYAGRTNEGC